MPASLPASLHVRDHDSHLRVHDLTHVDLLAVLLSVSFLAQSVCSVSALTESTKRHLRLAIGAGTRAMSCLAEERQLTICLQTNVTKDQDTNMVT